MNIGTLINKYETNRDHYLTDDYNEAQLRIDFLNPFFELLGWDITNEQEKNTNEREVILEESLKMDSFSNAKKPDYTFRLFSERKFFLEAKKPSVKVEMNPDSAKQIRRYGFTAKLKISVLSNFEYLAIYDCSHQVEEKDLATKARIKLYHYKDYEKYFDEIQAQLGKKEVYSGHFDKTWSHIEERLKLFSIDKLFLKQINNWRLMLGKEIYEYKSDISGTELNDIVQSYINSIIFLRVCEDRHLEEYKNLLGCVNTENFQSLIDKFIKADKKYNSGLFKHVITRKIMHNNESAFWSIIRQLYYPESTYSFSVFASDILGNIYEMFIGQQLSIFNDEIILINKPEHIDRDIITTPTYIIQAILKSTVAEYCKNKTDLQILNANFADLACGSGSFLLETFQLLNDILIDYYRANNPKKLIQTSINTYKLPFKLKRQILESCIYGVDKDYNAVEACKFGLLLKLLENENNNTISIPALPNLSNNIHFGNSLIDSEKLSGELLEVINPFDFGQTKFNVIIGNPPYMATEHMKKLTPHELPLYKEKYLTAYKQFDKYFLFIERGLDLLNDDGLLGYIVPSKFIKVGAAKKLRKLLLDNKLTKQIVSFGANQIFQDKTTYTCLLILKKAKQKSLRYFEIKNIADWKARKTDITNTETIKYEDLNDDVWVLVPKRLQNVFVKINSQSQALGKIVGDDGVCNGIQTSANNIYIHEATKITENYYYFVRDNKVWKIEKQITRPYYKTIKGKNDLNTYRSLVPNSFVIYPYFKKGGEIKLIKFEQLKLDFPCAYKYLIAHKKYLASSKRDVKPKPETKDEWYRYGRHQSLDKCDTPVKIIVGILSQGDKYAVDHNRTLISSGGTAGYCMITPPDNCKYSIYYIQALLNSKILEWYSAMFGEVFRGGYIARGTKVLKRLPIHTIDFNNRDEKIVHDGIALKQQELIEIQDKIDANIGNKRQLVFLNREFNNKKSELSFLLKKLYGLEKEYDQIPLISEIYAAN